MKCPNGHEDMVLKTVNKRIKFRGIELVVPVEKYHCPVCSIEFGTVEQTAKVQKAISESYCKRMKPILFGEFFKRKRIALRKTLRQFCLENAFDPGNFSQLERNLLPPPTSSDKIEQYAKALKIKKGSNEWYEFFDLARLSAMMIPIQLVENISFEKRGYEKTKSHKKRENFE